MKIAALNAQHAWIIVKDYVRHNKSFNSISAVHYTARISGDSIFYKGTNRNNGEEEMIARAEFVEAFLNIQLLKDINTNTIKPVIPNSLYQKRSPLVGLLHSSGILIQKPEI